MSNIFALDTADNYNTTCATFKFLYEERSYLQEEAEHLHTLRIAINRVAIKMGVIQN